MNLRNMVEKIKLKRYSRIMRAFRHLREAELISDAAYVSLLTPYAVEAIGCCLRLGVGVPEDVLEFYNNQKSL